MNDFKGAKSYLVLLIALDLSIHSHLTSCFCWAIVSQYIIAGRM